MSAGAESGKRGPSGAPPEADGAGVAEIGVGILGCGNVGGSLVALIDRHRDLIAARAGVDLRVRRVAVRNVSKDRPVDLPEGVLTADAVSVVADPDVDIVVEVIGGIEPARALILDALGRGKPVVTGNKELLANVGSELFEAAEAAQVDLLFEASVAGGIPLIRPLRESLAGERIRRVTGIVNGTTNFILTRMSEDGLSFADALAEAQSLGYAESDPTADVGGFDAAAKAAIIASIAFDAKVVAGDVYREGIAAITAADIAAARDLGFVVKLLAVAEEIDGSIAVRVHPAMIPAQHPLASVRGSFNAVFIEGAAVGELMLYGRGAGGDPTAVAVLGDLVDAAKNLRTGGHNANFGARPRVPIHPIDEVESQFYVTVDVADRPGVLAAIAGVFAKFDVSIQSMEQQGRGDEAHLIFVTHLAREADLRATMHEVGGLDAVERVGSVLRVVGGSG
jgi:homoserine dehydrogenase